MNSSTDNHSKTTIPAAAAEEPANRYTPDAQERIGRLRILAMDFDEESQPQPLTPAEVRLARGTSVAALEKAALLAEAAPQIGPAVVEAGELRDAIAYELAYSSVRDEARATARRIDMAILRRKLKAAKAARGLYRVAKGYITVDAGDSVRPHVSEMGRSLTKPRRRKAAAPPDGAVKKPS